MNEFVPPKVENQDGNYFRGVFYFARQPYLAGVNESIIELRVIEI